MHIECLLCARHSFRVCFSVFFVSGAGVAEQVTSVFTKPTHDPWHFSKEPWQPEQYLALRRLSVWELAFKLRVSDLLIKLKKK